MSPSLKKSLKKYYPFKLLSWLRNSYALDNIEYVKLFKRCGKDVRISNGVLITNCHMITVGDNVIIHSGVLINGTGGLHIGSNSGISYNTVIWTVEHKFVDADRIPFDEKLILKPVKINDNVAIGANVCISPGVEIGEGAIVGLASLVTKDVPPLAIVMGNPARVIGYRDQDHYEKCKAEGAFVRHSVYSDKIVPVFIQKRPRLYDIIRDGVERGEYILEREEEFDQPNEG
jgi:acetyltransferase-like isoleucine patch superfamily enzyme